MIPRSERKIVFPKLLEEPVLAWLEHSCIPDREHPRSQVTSLYYDTPGLDRLRAKVDGDHRKVKLRLRWYDGNGEACYLELKRREGGLCRKVRSPLAVPALALSDMGHEAHHAVVETARELGYREPGPHHPVARIRYRRHRFVDPATGLRLSVDTAIELEAASDLYLPWAVPCELGAGVLEIKGNGGSPSLLPPPVRAFPVRSFSKYAACVRAAHLTSRGT